MPDSALAFAACLFAFAAAAPAQQPVGGAVPAPPRQPEPPAPADDATPTPPPAPPAVLAEPIDVPPATEPPRARIGLALGAGRFRHHTDGSPAASDDTDGGYARLSLEYLADGETGLGIRLEGTTSDDDLFLATSGSAATASDGELLLHGTRMLGIDEVPMPLRFGLALRQYRIDDDTTGKIDWSSIGPYVEIEPDLRLAGDDSMRWSLCGRLGLFAGWTWIATDPSSEHWTTTSAGITAGLGTRLQARNIDLGIGYVLRTYAADESDAAGGFVIRRFDARFQGIEVSFGARF